MTVDSDINATDQVTTSVGEAPLPRLAKIGRHWNRYKSSRLHRVVSKIIYRVDRIFGDLISIVLGLGIVALWLATTVLEKQSTDLTVLRPNIKIWFADAFNGREADFGRLELTWLPVENHIVVTMEDAEIRGPADQLLEKFELVRSTLEFDPNLHAKPRLLNAQIKGGVLTYFEDEDGRIIAGLGPPETVGRVGPVYKSGETSRSNSDIRSILQDIEFVQIDDARVHVRNDISGIDLESNVKSLRANFSEAGDLTVTAAGTITQISEPMPFVVNMISDAHFETMKLRLEVKNARPDEIAPTKGRFWELQGLAAPVDLNAAVEYSRQSGLRSASVDMEISQGRFLFLREDTPRVFPITNLVTRASLEPGNERMEVDVLNLSSPKLSFNSSGFLTELGNLSDGDENSSPIFDLAFQNLQIDMTPLFESEIEVKALNLVGQADVDSRSLDITRGQLEIFGSTHDFDGKLIIENDNRLNTVIFNSEMSGIMRPEEFLSLWPSEAFGGARRWIDRSVISGDITQLDAEIALDPAFFNDRSLTADRLKLYFGGRNTAVRYMETLPPAVEVSGWGEIIGNRLDLSLDSGRVDAITLLGGTVEIPRLLPKGGDIVIEANGRGQASELMRLADFPPFEIASRYNVDPNAISGVGDVSIGVTRPLLEFFPRERIEYQIKGNFTEATAPFEIANYKITNGTISLDANKERVLMTGPVKVGPWPADIRWLETFGEDAPPAQYGVSGRIDADILDELGLGSRTWFDGSADLKLEAQGRGKDIAGAKIDLDLTNSELSVERIWMKAAGEGARLTGQLSRGLNSSYIVENARLTGADIVVGGKIEMESDYKIRQIDLSEMSIKSVIEGAVQITPNREAGTLEVSLAAEYLNVSPWTQELFAERQSNLDVPLILKGRVANLVLDEFYTVTESDLYFSHTGEVIQTARLEALSDGEPVKLELSTREDRKRQFEMSIPDASKAVSAFMGMDNITGGQLEISANLPAAGEDGAFVGEADMRNFRLKEAPALAQLLSLASLTGLADTLTGGGMQFERFKLPFTILEDDIAIRDARLYGPALGMTGNGDVDLDLRVLDFDGTLVPAYTANSVLGDIPVLGDIFVQEKDGGLFALTYTVSGPFEQTQIAVNPLSALTPGFLRGIFKRDRSDADEAMREAIEDITPNEAIKSPDPLEAVEAP